MNDAYKTTSRDIEFLLPCCSRRLSSSILADTHARSGAIIQHDHRYKRDTQMSISS